MTPRTAVWSCSPAWVTLLVASVLFGGCSTTPRSPRATEATLHAGAIPTSGGDASVAHLSPAAPTELRWVTLEPLRGDLFPLDSWPSDAAPGSKLPGADASAVAPRAPVSSAPGESLFSKDYWKLVGQDIKEVFTAPASWDTADWLVVSGVTAGIVAVGVFDEQIQKAVQRNSNQTVNDVFNAVTPFGSVYSFAVLGGFYLGGEAFREPKAKAVALDGLSASIIASWLIVEPMKYAVGRSRPNQNQGAYSFEPFSGSDSFPSGHATRAFAVATVIAEHYDALWVKLTSYGLASMVGYARLNSNVHWASDVMAGAAIGTFVGHVVVRFNQHHRRLSLIPILSPHAQGAQLSWPF